MSADSPAASSGRARFLEGARGGDGPADPRDAATVILLKPLKGGGYATFLAKRAQSIAFMGGAHVFPGGRVDPKLDPNVEAAAVREVEEETGVKLDVRSLRLFARWVTPEIEPKRFDARFFVTAVPHDQLARADGAEITEGVWMAPGAAIELARAGRITLPPPTLWNLTDLAELPTVESVIAEAARRASAGIEIVQPRALELATGALALLLPGDPQETDPESRPSDAAKRRFELVDGRWRMFRGPR